MLTRVGLLWPFGGGLGADLQLQELRPAAMALKLKLEEIEIQLVERLSNGKAETGRRDHDDFG